MSTLVKKISGRNAKRLSTQELGELLGCSKNKIVSQAKKFHWKREQQRNSRGQLVTTYAMTEVQKIYPELGRPRPQSRGKQASKSAPNGYETPELVEAVQSLVREYVEIQRLTVEAQEQAVQRIVKAFAASVGLLLFLTATVGLTFWQWHRTEFAALQRLREKDAIAISIAAEEPTARSYQLEESATFPAVEKTEIPLAKVAMRGLGDELEAENWPEE